jgi:pilus assembly protein Flp/PilA
MTDSLFDYRDGTLILSRWFSIPVPESPRSSPVSRRIKFLKKGSSMNFKNQRGAGIVEYAMLIALLAIIALAALKGFGEQLGLTFSEITSSVEEASTNPG